MNRVLCSVVLVVLFSSFCWADTTGEDIFQFDAFGVNVTLKVAPEIEYSIALGFLEARVLSMPIQMPAIFLRFDNGYDDEGKKRYVTEAFLLEGLQDISPDEKLDFLVKSMGYNISISKSSQGEVFISVVEVGAKT